MGRLLSGVRKVQCRELVFSGHALRRMFERRIRADQVRSAVESGQVITEYREDVPFPSCLVLGYVVGQPVHVVVGLGDGGTCVVVTVYTPSAELWDTDFKTKKVT